MYRNNDNEFDNMNRNDKQVGGGQNGSVLSSTEFYRPELDEWQARPRV